MSSNDDAWRQYYEKALQRRHALKTELAVNLNTSGQRTAIDCGCGTGSEIAYLNQQGYRVRGFDVNPDAVAICRERFAGNFLIDVTQARFEDYDYPESGLVIANSSLFFADPSRFEVTWKRIETAIAPGGVFAGDFMGSRDSWAEGYRSPVTALERSHVERLFKGFDIIELKERDEPGQTALGITKHWHMYSVIAVKKHLSQASS